MQDANFAYTWDEENRMVTRTPLSPSTNDLKYSYEYDYMGRRIKSVSHYWTGTAWAHFHTETFLYDGWNAVCTYSKCLTGTVGWQRREWTWGLDLSGSIHGAGGVGGLLKAKGWIVPDSTAYNTLSYNYLYDGNGNVTGIVGPTWGASLGAKYEYDAFGRTVVSAYGPVGSLTFAFMNPYRFSTKHWDMASRSDSQGHNSGGWSKRLYYYGYRYYDPVTGRWLSRDPIGERGGLNLYGFVGNDGIGRWDYLGLECIEGDRKSVIHEVNLSVYNRRGLDSKRITELADEIISGLEGMSDIEGLSSLAKAASLGKKELANEGTTAALQELGLPGYGDFMFDAAGSIMDHIREMNDRRANNEGAGDFRGGMIVVYVRCCECICKRSWIFRKKRVWDCGDPQQFNYVVHRDGRVLTLDEFGQSQVDEPMGFFPKPASRITSLDVALAIKRARESANCEEAD